jgi:hypothetical protein
MNRSQRIEKANAIYLEELANFEAKLTKYQEDYAIWEKETQEDRDFNFGLASYQRRAGLYRPIPPKPSYPESPYEISLLRIMSELSLSRDMTREYLAVIKYRNKK